MRRPIKNVEKKYCKECCTLWDTKAGGCLNPKYGPVLGRDDPDVCVWEYEELTNFYRDKVLGK